MQTSTLLAATDACVLVVDVTRGAMLPTKGLERRSPACLATDPRDGERAWCGTEEDGVYASEDAGASWRPCGLAGEHVTALAASPVERNVVWAGTEPSAVWRSPDCGATWTRTREVTELPSSRGWSFPPRPDTHHVRFIACHPREPGRLLVAIEAGALISTIDGGKSWRDKVPGGPFDTHELAIHPAAPEALRVSAGDGYFESTDGGATWSRPRVGLEVGYMRSVAIDPGNPDVVVVSAASHPFRAYGARASDGRIYRRVADAPWERVAPGWPDPPATIAPVLAGGSESGELFAADERGVHRSADAGASWARVAAYPEDPRYVAALARLAS